VTQPRSAHGQHTLAGEYFTSEEIFRREQERIFSRRWLYAGHVGELRQPGSYFLFELGNECVILLRDGGGEVRALHNVCRHRGSRLCLEPAGELGRSIRCPYHAWTYELDGRLRAAPNMAEVAGFERATCPLLAAPLCVREGLLFVHLGAEPEPFERELEAFAGRFERWRIAAGGQTMEVVFTVTPVSLSAIQPTFAPHA